MKRKYVDVICLNDQAGNIKPLYLIWNNDRKIPILKVKEICPRASLKVGGSGLRYTCLFDANRTRHLYYDRGKWFVEVNDNVL
ncbi:MAG: hypothetical protein IKE38_02935 [Erysipelotrichaceae bacterium]|nr:hypothetical protein [Erysipelotrichaceae bacterium]